MSDELTLNAEDSDVAPESPILFQIECGWVVVDWSYSIINSSHRFNWVSDELTFNAEDNDVVPDDPILL